MAKNVKLLLTETVEALGIVGDVVTVRTGYARNFLLPRELATDPSEEKIAALAAKRAEAEKMLAAVRSQREQMVEKLSGVEISLERSCNDQGMLYGSVTQHDIAAALNAKGFGVRPRDVRLGQTIKRVDHYDILIKPEVDLEAHIKLQVLPDRPLDLNRMEASAETVAAAAAPAATAEAAAPADGEKSRKGKHAEESRSADKHEKHDKHEKAEKHEKHEKSEKRAKGDKAEKGEKKSESADGAEKVKKGGWGVKVPEPVIDIGRPRGRRR